MPQRRHVVRAAVSTAATTACLAIATPAWASSTIPLHTAHEDAYAAKFQQECGDDKFEDRPADHDGWHFVLDGNKKTAGDFQKLTLTFKNLAGETVTVNVPDNSDAYPDFLSANGEDGQVKHAYVFTPAGWQLLDGSAVISGEADKFNLSHTCAGTGASQSPSSPSTPTSPSGSVTPSESTSVSPSAGTGGSGGDDSEGGLPVTGAAATTMALLGIGLVGGGATLVAMRRRRDKITFTS